MALLYTVWMFSLGSPWAHLKQEWRNGLSNFFTEKADIFLNHTKYTLECLMLFAIARL